MPNAHDLTHQRIRAALALGLVGVLVALLVVPAAGSTSATTQGRAQLDKVTIAALALDPAGPVMYAKDRGFFRQQGIDAEIKILADGTQTVPALLSGQADFTGLPPSGLAILKVNKLPVKAVAALAVYRPRLPTTGVFVAPGKRISRARDLVGKRINVDFQNSVVHIGLLRWLQRGGVSRDQVTLSTLPFAQSVAPLLRGDFDAAVLVEPQATQALQGGARRIALPFDSVCSDDCLLTVAIARSNVDPNLAARFRNAVQAAAVWANQKRNQAASARILARYASIKPALVEKMTRTPYATRLRVGMARPWIDLYAEYDLIPDSFTPADLLK
jgi:NitT/TauT family transport system substrate-binding protein